MTIYLEDFKEIVTNIENYHKESEEYLHSLREVDTSLSEFINENKYTDSLYFQNQFLLTKLLGEDLYGWLTWYLYELPCFFNDGSVPNCSVDDVEYNVTDIHSFMDFAQHGLKLPMKPKHENE